MLKRFTSFLDDHVADTPLMAIPMAFLITCGCIFIVLTACYFDPNAQFDNDPSNDWIWWATVLLSLSSPILFFILKGVDDLIEYTSRQITDGDFRIQNFFLRHVFYTFNNWHGGEKICGSYIQVVFVIGPLLSLAFIFVLLMIQFPWLSVVPILLGSYFAFVKLARLAYRTHKRLNVHVNDPNAHTKEKENV